LNAAGVAAGGTALALATIPPAATVAAPASALDPVYGLDAEIIAAGKAFEPLLSKYLDAQFIWTRLSREASDETDAKFPSDDFDGPGENPKWNFHSRWANKMAAQQPPAGSRKSMKKWSP
jgi:hypothetical protein